MREKRGRQPIKFDDMGRPIVAATAHYARTCIRCGQAIEPGQEMKWKLGERRDVVHARCPVSSEESNGKGGEA